MKKITVIFLALSLLLTGCSSWMDGEYHSVRPHAYDGPKLSDDVVAVFSYEQLRDALVEMVTSGRQQSTFHIAEFTPDDVDKYMKEAIAYVHNRCAIGAYAVEEITYESGTSGGVFALAVDVSYLHGRQEILRLKRANNMEGARNFITAALRSCDSSVVILVNSYGPLDIEQFVQEYVSANPQICMEMPQVTDTVYPKQGTERVLEISFTYQNNRDTLKMMQNMVSPIFSAAELYVRGSEGEVQKYEQLCSFLMERFDYSIETSITPLYSLLRYGVGDSKAFAMAYSIMCQNAELPCQVVSGTKNGEAYHWNLIRIEETDYHVDLLESSQAGEFLPMLPEAMTGYVWDYNSYE